jgi:hypothetical protein
VSKFTNEQLRGAYRAGYEAGHKDGAEGLRREGWVRPKSGDDVRPGDIVKVTARTLFGWRGLARVIHADDRGVHAQKLDHPADDYGGTVGACLHEVMVRRGEVA